MKNMQVFKFEWGFYDDYLMNETMREPITGRQSPSLFDKDFLIKRAAAQSKFIKIKLYTHRPTDRKPTDTHTANSQIDRQRKYIFQCYVKGNELFIKACTAQLLYKN